MTIFHFVITFTSLDIGQYMYSGCDVIKFEINLTFLIKPFWYITKRSRQKLKYFENEKSFWGKVAFEVHFWIYLLNHNSLTHQTWPLDRYKKGQYFYLATSSNYSIANYAKFPVFHLFQKVNKGELKMVNISN